MDPDTTVPVVIPFSEKSAGIPIRSLKLSFPAGAFPANARLAELRFLYDWGPWQDAEENPEE